MELGGRATTLDEGNDRTMTTVGNDMGGKRRRRRRRRRRRSRKRRQK
jgi:hypothetical protein